MKGYPIFISSADSYSDLWPIFFRLFKEYWPEYEGNIFLNTEKKSFHDEQLYIHCTQVGEMGSFGKTFRAGLDQVKSSYIMLIMIDYFFIGKVNDDILNEYFKFFINNELDTLCLVSQPYDESEKLNFKDLRLVIPPSRDMFSFQISFWKREKLYQMVLPHENPWLAEWYGTKRANLMKINLAYPNKNRPIPYLAEGALHKGKWVQPMINFLNKKDYDMDFSRRGIYIAKQRSLYSRVKDRIKTLKPRVFSNIDLYQRKLFR